MMNNTTDSENIVPTNLRPFSAPVKRTTEAGAATLASHMTTPVKNTGFVTKTPSNSRPSTSAKKLSANTPVSSREAAILAKAQHTAEKQKRTHALKEKWAKEKQQKKEMIVKKREEDLKTREKLSNLHAKQRKKCIEKNNHFTKTKKEIQKELLKSSISDHIEARKMVDEEKKRRRRQSIMINNEILAKSKKNQSKLLRKQKEEEDSLLVSRRIDFLATRESQIQEDERRRKSLEAKNDYSKMQHELDKEFEAVKKEQMQDILVTRKEMYEDDIKTKEAIKKSRRQSLIGRLDTWRSQRKVEDATQKKQQEILQLNIIQKHEDWLDIQEAKQEYRNRERQSVLWRLDKWRETKDLETEERIQKQMIEETERDLFLQEYEDVMQYKQEQEDLRRQSLAYRLDQASREKEWERGEEYVLQAQMEQEFAIKTEERFDISQYKTQLKEDRRRSLAFRLEQQSKDREFFEGQTANEQNLLTKEYELRNDDRKAIRDYKEQEKQAERKAIAKSISESQKLKEKALLEHRKLLDQMHADFESKANDHNDVKNYQASEKERSRQSICLRLDSWRLGKMMDERQKTRQRLIKEADIEQRNEDFYAIQDAKAQEALDEKARNIKCFL